jgi:hypothetical protein
MYSPIPELNRLKEFSDGAGDFFAPEFELHDFGADDGGYPDAADRLRPFALATGSGSSYALWLMDDRDDLAGLPVVFLGDEGGIHLVAPDVREFLRVLASGWTPWGSWEELTYFDAREEEDHDPCPANAGFRVWLKRHYGLDAAEDPNVTVAATKDLLWDRFAAWIGPLYPDVVNARRT